MPLSYFEHINIFFANLNTTTHIKSINCVLNYLLVLYRFTFHSHINDIHLFISTQKSFIFQFFLDIFYLFFFYFVVTFVTHRRLQKKKKVIFLTIFLFFFVFKNAIISSFIIINYQFLFSNFYFPIFYFFYDNPILHTVTFDTLNTTNEVYFVLSDFLFIEPYCNVLRNRCALLIQTAFIFNNVYYFFFVFLLCIFFFFITHKLEYTAHVKNTWHAPSNWFFIISILWIALNFLIPLKIVNLLTMHYYLVYSVAFFYKSKNFYKTKTYIENKTKINNIFLKICIILTCFSSFFEWFGNNTPNTSLYFWENVHQAALAFWAVSWCFFLFKGFAFNTAPITLVYVFGFLKPLFISYIFFFFKTDSLLFYIVVLLYFLSVSIPNVATIFNSPDRAPERERKIMMFTDAEPAIDKPTIYGTGLFYNTNCYSILFYFFSFTTDFLLCQKMNSKLYAVFLTFYIFFIIFVWLSVLGCIQLVEAVKTDNVLDWRGFFFTIHHYYYWILKYSLFMIYLFLLFYYIFLVTSVLQTISFNLHSLLYLSLLFVYVVCFFIFEKFVVLWSTVLPYFQDDTPEYWNDNLWVNMSPFMRDLLYWTPIRPDDYVELGPSSFVGFCFKHSTRMMWMFIYVYIFLFAVVVNNILIIEISFLLWAFKYAAMGLCYVFWDRYYGYTHFHNIKIISDYMLVEFWTQICNFFIYMTAVYFMVSYGSGWGTLLLLGLYYWNVRTTVTLTPPKQD